MSVLEKNLIDAAFRGEWAGVPKLPVLSNLFVQEEANITIRGAFLREFLLGLHPPATGAEQNLRLHGIRLRGAIIKGEIDLGDCTGMDGAPLPPLLLEHCIMSDGTLVECCIVRDGVKQKILRAINASNARLSRLSLNGCRVGGRIDLTDATLDGDLEISGVAPLDNDSPCQIFARRCRIDGSVIAATAHLRILSGQLIEVDVPDFALNLTDAKIQGSIILQPGFRAEGGVSVRGAHVGGDIWAEAAKFTASDEIAFRAESLQCGGAVALRGYKETGDQESRHCEVLGRLDFLSATIGFLDLRGIHISKSRSVEGSAADREVLNLYLARVRDNFWLGNLSSVPKTVVEGPIIASAMTVGGDWDLRGLTLNLSSDWKYSGITAENLRVGGDLNLAGPITSIDLTSSHVEHNLSVNNTVMVAPENRQYGLVARNIRIGNDCKMEYVSGTVDLELSRIGGELRIHAKDLVALNARSAEVRGAVTISGKFRPSTNEQLLCFDGGSYLSGFYIGDPKTKNAELNSLGFLNSFLPSINPPKQKDKLIPTLSIEGAHIENDFWVTKVWSVSAGDPQYVLLEANKVALSFYPNWMLVEALFLLDNGNKAIIAFLQHQSDEPVLLMGQSAPIHQLNQRGLLNLDSEQKVRDYLRFFCAYVWGEEGPFFIIESEKALRGATLLSPVKLVGASVKRDKQEDWTCVALIRYADGLYRAELHVKPDGNVVMSDDELLAEIKEQTPVRFEPPLRIITSSRNKADTVVSPFWLPLICNADSVISDSYNDIESMLRWFGAQVAAAATGEIPRDIVSMLRQLGQHSALKNKAIVGTAEISLRGLRARVFHHDLEKSWVCDIKLKLDGFDYDRVETVILNEAEVDVETKTESLGLREKFGLREKLKRNAYQALLEPVSSSAPQPIDKSAAAHKSWLSLQYSNETADGYEPQPYEQLARALRNDGKYEVAKSITKEKLSLERRFVHHWWARPFLWLMETFFDYGLFARRSVPLFFTLWIIGTFFFDFLNYGCVSFPPLGSQRNCTSEFDKPVLVIDPVFVRTLILPDTAELDTNSGPVVKSMTTLFKDGNKQSAVDDSFGSTVDQINNPGAIVPEIEKACGDQVEVLWYALDVFVPLLDLKQEDKCSITTRDDEWGWRALKNLYAILGAIVTSITLLTVSGMLRRYIER